MPKWKKDETEFTVGVNYDERRGAQISLPKPIAKRLGNPKKVRFSLRGRRIEFSSA
jgi:hypothetical protein